MKKSVGILSTLSHPLLSRLIEAFQRSAVNVSVIADSQDFSAKDFRIWNERTGGSLDNAASSIYDVGAAVPFYFVRDHNDERCCSIVKELAFDVIINGGTPRKLTGQILSIAPFGAVSVHPGVLPKYRGSCCVEWAVLNDDPVGNTAYFMTEGYDAGPIIDSETYSFGANVTYQDIRSRVYVEGINLMVRSVNMLLEKHIFASNLADQDEGQFYRPIDSKSLELVKEKISSGAYSEKVKFARKNLS